MRTIFHLITTINRGGAENQLLVLASEQIKSGFDVHVAYLKGEPELKADFELSGITVHDDLATTAVIFQPLRFRKLLNKRNVIVHAHLPRAELVAFFTLAKFKFFASRHNAEPFFPGAPKNLSNLLSKMVEIRSIKIIAISNAVKDFLIERGEIAHRVKVDVVHYGYNRRFTGVNYHENIDRTNINWGTISRLTDQKDIPTMLRAFSKFKEVAPGSTLSILGAGPLEVELKALTKTMKLDQSVQFLGRSSRIYDFLADLDVFILTSKYEGFGMVLLEAMDAAIPIVASGNSAIPEVLGINFPGLCTTGDSNDFYQKIIQLSNVAYRKRILELQKIQLNIFRADLMTQKISEIYDL